MAILKTVCAAVVCASTILFEPNAIERVLVLVELNMPVVKSNPLSANAPEVKVTVPVAAIVNAEPNDVVPAVLLIISDTKVVLVLLVIVPVPSMVGVKVVNVPPLDNVSPLAKFNAVVPGLNVVVPKLNVLNQPAVVNVATLVPVVNVKFTAFDVEPPVVPNVNVLVLAMAATVNPPGPVLEKLVTIAILNTTVAAVV